VICHQQRGCRGKEKESRERERRIVAVHGQLVVVGAASYSIAAGSNHFYTAAHAI
jgi:hypothetical protein